MKKLPSGIILIIIVTLIAFFSYVMTATAKSAFVFGSQIYGPIAIAFGIICAAIAASIIYGLYNAAPWACKLTIGFTLFEIINGIANLAFSGKINLGLSKLAMPILIASGVLFDAMVVWYLYTKKNYFLNKKEKVSYDRLFIILGLGIVLLGLIAASILIYSDFSKISRLTEEARELIEGKNIAEAMELCQGRGDYCFMAIATVNVNNTESVAACDKITEPQIQSACGSMFAIVHNNSEFCSAIKDFSGAAFCRAVILKNSTYCGELPKENEKSYCYDYIRRLKNG